jgi:hypothetical protein
VNQRKIMSFLAFALAALAAAGCARPHPAGGDTGNAAASAETNSSVPPPDQARNPENAVRRTSQDDRIREQNRRYRARLVDGTASHPSLRRFLEDARRWLTDQEGSALIILAPAHPSGAAGTGTDLGADYTLTGQLNVSDWHTRGPLAFSGTLTIRELPKESHRFFGHVSHGRINLRIGPGFSVPATIYEAPHEGLRSTVVVSPDGSGELDLVLSVERWIIDLLPAGFLLDSPTILRVPVSPGDDGSFRLDFGPGPFSELFGE